MAYWDYGDADAVIAAIRKLRFNLRGARADAFSNPNHNDTTTQARLSMIKIGFIDLIDITGPWPVLELSGQSSE